MSIRRVLSLAAPSRGGPSHPPPKEFEPVRCRLYGRNCNLVAPCCGAIVCCHVGHEESTCPHKLDRSSAQQLLCLSCKELVPVDQKCQLVRRVASPAACGSPVKDFTATNAACVASVPRRVHTSVRFEGNATSLGPVLSSTFAPVVHKRAWDAGKTRASAGGRRRHCPAGIVCTRTASRSALPSSTVALWRHAISLSGMLANGLVAGRQVSTNPGRPTGPDSAALVTNAVRAPATVTARAASQGLGQSRQTKSGLLLRPSLYRWRRMGLASDWTF